MAFHEKTLKLLQIDPRRSDISNAELREVNKRISRSLPTSMMEWYAIEGVVDLMLKYSNADEPVPIGHMGLKQVGAGVWTMDPLLSRNLLVIRHENQGVMTWAVELDGSDDPPVLVSYEDNFTEPIDTGLRFSDHVFHWMWDFAGVLMHSPVIQSQNAPFSPAARAALESNFDRHAVSYGWPGHTQRRFFRKDNRILIWESERQADWWLTADSDAELERLVQAIWHLDDLRRSLWSHEDRGIAILKHLGLKGDALP